MQIDEQYKVKYLDLRRKKLLKKVLMLQNTFKELFLHKSPREIIHILSHCGHYHYRRKKTPIAEEEKIMYEYLVTHNYNPYTVYKWFLWFITAQMMTDEVKNNTINQDQIRRIVTTRKRTEELAKSWKFMEQQEKQQKRCLTINIRISTKTIKL